MNFIVAWWEKICQPLDGFLWRRNISDPIVRPLLRNQIYIACASLLAGSALYFAFPWLFWFGCGAASLAWIFWSWARFFSATPKLGDGILKSVLLRFYLRFAAFAAALYLALAVCDAPAGAIIAGMAGGAAATIIGALIALKGARP